MTVFDPLRTFAGRGTLEEQIEAGGAEAGEEVRVRLLAVALLVSACASPDTAGYRLVTQTHHGPIVWSKFKTLERCEEARRGSDASFNTRCITAEEARR